MNIDVAEVTPSKEIKMTDTLDYLPLGQPVQVHFLEPEVGLQTLYVAGYSMDTPGQSEPTYMLSENWPIKCRGDVTDGWTREAFGVEVHNNHRDDGNLARVLLTEIERLRPHYQGRGLDQARIQMLDHFAEVIRKQDQGI